MDNRLDSWISKVISGDGATPAPQPERSNSAPQPAPSAQPKPEPRREQKKFPRRDEKSRPWGQRKRRSPDRPHPDASSNAGFSVQTPHPEQQKSGSGLKLRMIPLGGLNEVGRNSMALEYGQDMIIIDAGLQFPEGNMYGVQYLLPDTRYAEQKKQNIRALLITHAHLDHIGGLPYILPRLGFPPVYAPPLAAALIERKLSEHEGLKNIKVNRVNAEKDVLRFGAFTVEYFHVNHSIPDASGLYVTTPAGTIVHTGDFKFDFSPADGIPADFGKIAKIGLRGVDVIFADSTNAQKEGFCVSERVVAETLENIIKNTRKGRLFITSFSSVLGRWQQIIRFAQKYNRKIYVTGRSLLETLRIASDMGLIRVPHGVIHKVTKRMHDTPPHEQLIITTGAQGEDNAALARIIRGEHDTVYVEKGDTVVFSAMPIPGNERNVITLINGLYKIGANVITRNQLDVHTSGHGYQGDLKLMYALMKPKNIVPVHGEYHMRVDHARMVQNDLGYAEENTAILSNGDVLEISHGKIHRTHEKAPGEEIFVDGKMLGDIGGEVQSERKALMKGGVLSVVLEFDASGKKLTKAPLVKSLGFAYPHEDKNLHQKLTQEADRIATQVTSRLGNARQKHAAFEQEFSEKLGGMIMELTGREPRILLTLA